MPSDLKGTYKKEHTEQIVRDVAIALKLAANYKMEVEVMFTAMVFLKENPKATIHDALKAGLTDWDLEWDKF
jgi:hypothetical protein